MVLWRRSRRISRWRRKDIRRSRSCGHCDKRRAAPGWPNLFFAAAAIVRPIAVRYYFTGHQVPAGQLPLNDLTRASLDSLKSDFNRAPEQVRIILLLSPT